MMNRLWLFALMFTWLLPVKASGTFCEGDCKDLISSIVEDTWEQYPEECVVKRFESMNKICLAEFIEELHLGNTKYIDFSIFILEKVSDHKEALIGELQYLLSVDSDQILKTIHNRNATVVGIVCGTSASKYYSMARQSIDERLDAVLNSSLGKGFDPIVTHCIDKLENAEKEMLEGMWK